MAINLQDWLVYTKANDLANIADERFNELMAAWDAYYGRHPKPLAIEVRQNQGPIDDNVSLNSAQSIVDTAVAALTGEGLEIEINGAEVAAEGGAEPAAEDDTGAGAIDTEDDSPEELWWEPIAEANRFDILLHNTALNGAVCGHLFWKILPSSPVTGDGKPRIINLNPAMVSVSCNEEDMAEVWAYQIRYEIKGTGKPKQRLEVISRGEAGLAPDGTGGVVVVPSADNTGKSKYWVITDYDYAGDSRAWVQVSQVIWPYEFAPIIDAENLPDPSRYYGMADLRPSVIDMDKAIDRVASIINRVCRIVGHPRPVATGVDAKQAGAFKEAKIGDTYFLPNPEAKMMMLEMAGDLSALGEQYQRLTSALMRSTATPDIDTNKLGDVGKLSALAMKILYAPQERRVYLKRLNFEALITNTIKRLRVITGQSEAISISYHWPNVTPANQVEDVEVAVKKNMLGISMDTLIAELGYNPAEEAAKRELESQSAGAIAEAAFNAGSFNLPGDRMPTAAPAAPTAPTAPPMGD